MSNHEVTLDLVIHLERETALQVSLDGNEEASVWIPTSQIEVGDDNGGTTEITMPEWLAIKKELV